MRSFLPLFFFIFAIVTSPQTSWGKTEDILWPKESYIPAAIKYNLSGKITYVKTTGDKTVIYIQKVEPEDFDSYVYLLMKNGIKGKVLNEEGTSFASFKGENSDIRVEAEYVKDDITSVVAEDGNIMKNYNLKIVIEKIQPISD